MDNISNTLRLLYEERNNLIIRIAGVSDEIIKLQLQEEYSILDQKINTYEEEYCILFIEDLTKDFIEYYESMYNKTNLTNSIKHINDIDLDLSKYRLREPNLSDRRSLILLSNTLNKQIIIYDMEQNIIDEIGKTTNDKLKIIVHNLQGLKRNWDNQPLVYK